MNKSFFFYLSFFCEQKVLKLQKEQTRYNSVGVFLVCFKLLTLSQYLNSFILFFFCLHVFLRHVVFFIWNIFYLVQMNDWMMMNILWVWVRQQHHYYHHSFHRIHRQHHQHHYHHHYCYNSHQPRMWRWTVKMTVL